MNYYSKYDITGFAEELGLSISEISELYTELINEMDSALSELKKLIIKKDLESIQKIIHNIKGVSGNYRLTDVYEKASKINNSLRSNYLTHLESDLNELFIISSMAEIEITNFFKERFVYI